MAIIKKQHITKLLAATLIVGTMATPSTYAYSWFTKVDDEVTDEFLGIETEDYIDLDEDYIGLDEDEELDEDAELDADEELEEDYGTNNAPTHQPVAPGPNPGIDNEVGHLPVEDDNGINNDVAHFPVEDDYGINNDVAHFPVVDDNGINNDVTHHPVAPELPDISDYVSHSAAGVSNVIQVLINGRLVETEAYNINGSNYLGLRNVATLFDSTVDWDAATKLIVIKSNANLPTSSSPDFSDYVALHTIASSNMLTISLDGVGSHVEAYLINNSNYLGLRNIASLFNCSVDYNTTTKLITITSNITPR